MAFVTDPIGIIGEEEAAKVLKKKGFKILEHNWRMGHLEVDLIAENRQEIAFVEVKARTTEFGNIRPEEYVDEDKKHRMLVAANAYMKKTHTDKSPRFDIFGILVNPETEEVTYCNHLENVFAPTLRTCNTGSFNGACKWRKKKR
jgi:putative endonuclease